MKKFLTHTIGFIAIPAIILFSIYFNTFLKIDNQVNDIAVDNSTLLLGDSQTQRINPDYFNHSTFNFASPGEPYLVTYYKLIKVLSFNNHNIKTVILGCSMHNFASAYEESYDMKSSAGSQTLKKSMYYVDILNDSILSFKDFISDRMFYLGIWKGQRTNGLFESTNKNPSVETIKKTLNGHYKSTSKFNSTEFFEQEFYLKKIIELCKIKKVKLYLLTLPLHQYYKDNIPPICVENYKSIINQFELNHINYLSDDINNEYMSDGNHLNSDGAAIYSKVISEIVEIDMPKYTYPNEPEK